MSASHTPQGRLMRHPALSRTRRPAIQSTSALHNAACLYEIPFVHVRIAGKKVLLVDVRSEEEMRVSMLKGALTRRATPSSQSPPPFLSVLTSTVITRVNVCFFACGRSRCFPRSEHETRCNVFVALTPNSCTPVGLLPHFFGVQLELMH